MPTRWVYWLHSPRRHLEQPHHCRFRHLSHLPHQGQQVHDAPSRRLLAPIRSACPAHGLPQDPSLRLVRLHGRRFAFAHRPRRAGANHPTRTAARISMARSAARADRARCRPLPSLWRFRRPPAALSCRSPRARPTSEPISMTATVALPIANRLAFLHLWPAAPLNRTHTLRPHQPGFEQRPLPPAAQLASCCPERTAPRGLEPASETPPRPNCA